MRAYAISRTGWIISLLLALTSGVFSACKTVPQQPVTQPEQTTSAAPIETRINDEAESEEAIWDEGFETLEPKVSDPLEPINRIFFHLNDVVYSNVLDPFSRGYAAVLNPSIRSSIDRFFNNWDYPIRVVNSSLQGKFQRAGIETQRFVINTTLGLLGFFDPAEQYYQLAAPPPEGLGQTLAHWGIHSGPYLVLPLLGPTTLRDAGGRFGDIFLEPIHYIPVNSVRIALRVEEFLNASPQIVGAYNAMKDSSIEPYLSLRSSYIQSRQEQIKK